MKLYKETKKYYESQVVCSKINDGCMIFAEEKDGIKILHIDDPTDSSKSVVFSFMKGEPGDNAIRAIIEQLMSTLIGPQASEEESKEKYEHTNNTNTGDTDR